MSDSTCGFSFEQFCSVLTQYGPELSAHEVAHLGKVSIRQVLCCHHHHDWAIQAVCGDWKGWKYRMRPLIGVRQRLPKEVAVFDDSGINKNTLYQTA
jgi:hypothetical protein